MFVAFMSLHILLCDEILSYFILRVEVIQSLNLNLDQKDLNLHKRKFKVNPANLSNPTWVEGIRLNLAQVKGFALPRHNPANLSYNPTGNPIPYPDKA
jgi:hypothetical protein